MTGIDSARCQDVDTVRKRRRDDTAITLPWIPLVERLEKRIIII